MQQKSLQTAKRLFYAKKFKDVVRLLEPKIFIFKEIFEYYLLLGLSCLYLNDFGSAYSYLNRAEKIKPNHTPVLLGLAVIALKKMEIDQALKIWLKVLDREPKNRTAARGLNIIKQGFNEAILSELIESQKISRLYPPVKFRIPLLIPLIVLFTLVLLVICSFLFFTVIKPAIATQRPEIDQIDLSFYSPTIIDNTGDYHIILKEEEIINIFEKAKDYLYQYRDNLALHEINKLLNSNASLAVKERAKALKSFVQTPDFTTIKDSFAFNTVRQDPLLYKDCFVLWKGKVVNLMVDEQKIRFNFLIGYHEEKELQGIVTVELDFAAKVENGYSYEILGQVVLAEDKIKLKGISLHRIVVD